MLRAWLRSLWSRMWFAVWLWFRPGIKWVLRHSTQLCELQRICYGTLAGAERSSKVEFSLEHSRHAELRKCCKYLDEKAKERQLRPDVTYYAVYAIVRVKELNTKLNPRLSGQLLSCIGSIWGYRQLVSEVESVRHVKCCTSPQSDEGSDSTQDVTDKLHQLWATLKPDQELQSLVSKQWQEIGFQGKDPCTDFRGMGLLGLENLLFFAVTHPSLARNVLSRSCHPQYGYSFAIVGINLTQLIYSLLLDGSLKHHMYNVATKHIKSSEKGGSQGLEPPSLRQFHQVYCYVYPAFDQLWLSEKPKDIMEFSRIREKFEAQLREKLAPFEVVLKSDVTIQV